MAPETGGAAVQVRALSRGRARLDLGRVAGKGKRGTTTRTLSEDVVRDHLENPRKIELAVCDLHNVKYIRANF